MYLGFIGKIFTIVKSILLKGFSVKSILENAWNTIRGKELVVLGTCNCCGQCCQCINLRGRGGWIRTKEQFKKLCETNPQYSRFYIISGEKSDYLQFDCLLYDDQKGCKDYDNRLDICRKYPDKSLILRGGKLVEGCGYTVKSAVPFKKYLEEESKKKRKNETHPRC